MILSMTLGVDENEELKTSVGTTSKVLAKAKKIPQKMMPKEMTARMVISKKMDRIIRMIPRTVKVIAVFR